MSFQLKILGSNSATPAYGRHHTAQLLNVQNHYFLIDCGEATQIQLSRYKCKTQRINHIFISHLHGDHYLGLMGLIFTMHLMGRQADLHIFGQKGLEEIIVTQLKYSGTVLNYTIIFRELNPALSEILFEDEWVEVKSFPLNHRIPCSGFIIKEKPKPYRIDKEKLPPNLSLVNIARLKKGEDIYDDQGNLVYKNRDLTLPPRKSRSYAYCSDTKYDETIIHYIKNVDLLYHEATFLLEREQWAEQTFHSTTEQAARIALLAEAKQLIIGHFSARYKDLTPFLTEARHIFNNTLLATEGEAIDVPDL
ncbi:Ribonuclease Z [Fulvivirga imtechensis AK7]|uniref:Ribonuclease Z n=1 Tax=Fulvivirga imtechensis AK7 TaxID=1237149 RepID=L8JYM9_9BACT|nr:ribonuclease Z [Fulvivirga imtechensis]ELR73258.1 Ribonuclease Z [Fulvivirga imtechensis AK7]